MNNSLEDDENEDYQDPAKLSAYLKSQIKGDGETYYILLDEAQLAITEAERRGKGTIRLYGILNTLMKRGNVDVFVTGSNSRFLSSGILTEFRGEATKSGLTPDVFAVSSTNCSPFLRLNASHFFD